MLTKIEGFGQKTAETLINRAKEFVEELEIKQQEKESLQKAEAEKAEEEEKMEASDVFNDDEEYVTEADDVPEASAPDLEGVEEDEDKKE